MTNALRLRYQTFLLRLWQKSEQGDWIISLESVGEPQQRHHFSSFDDLIIFLSNIATRAPPPRA